MPSCTHFCASGLPVRKVGQASLQRPHSVQVKASRPSFQVRSRAARAHLQRGRVGVVGQHRVEVHRRHPTRRRAAPQVQRGQRGDDVEVLAKRQDHEEREHGAELHPVDGPVGRRQHAGVDAREPACDEAAGEREVTLVRDARIPRSQQREAQAVEQQVGEHDAGDQPQHHQRLAVALQPARALHETAPQRVTHGDEHRQLHRVLERREQPAREARVHEGLVQPDHQQLHLARQQHQEADEDHRVHQPRLPLALDHATLQQAVDEHALQPRQRCVQARLRGQRGEQRELAPRERGEARDADQHQQRHAQRTHDGIPSGWRCPL